ncbi:MAG: hypothetical protein K0R68_2476, partial [Mycobacterium sp.]|nr:hypothetical protein [Mycobacterium sp.]
MTARTKSEAGPATVRLPRLDHALDLTGTWIARTCAW